MKKLVLILFIMLLGIGLVQALDEGRNGDTRGTIQKKFDQLTLYHSDHYPKIKAYLKSHPGDNLKDLDRAFSTLLYYRVSGDITQARIDEWLGSLEFAAASHLKRGSQIDKYTLDQISGHTVNQYLTSPQQYNNVSQD